MGRLTFDAFWYLKFVLKPGGTIRFSRIAYCRRNGIKFCGLPSRCVFWVVFLLLVGVLFGQILEAVYLGF